MLKHSLQPVLLLAVVCRATFAQSQVVRLPPIDAAQGAVATQYAAPTEMAVPPAAGTPAPALPLDSDDFANPPGSLPPLAYGLPPAVDAPVGPPTTLPAASGPQAVEDDPDAPRDSRNSAFQKLFLTDTWLARLGGNGLGMDDLEAGTVWGMPFPTRAWPLLVTPGFTAHFLDGPAGVDLPPRVYDAYTEFRWLPRVTPRFRADLGVTPGYYSDFQHGSRDALRITGWGAAIWQWTPKMKLVLGASYLDRHDVAVLPIVGLVWNPSDEWNLNMVFPKPKLARRIAANGRIYPPRFPGDAFCPEVQYWAYISGELGGGIWAFEHTGGGEDVFSYRDYRVMLGVERKALFGLASRLEVGYVFGRKIEFQSDLPDVLPSDTVMVRGGLTY
jgi:hypothetical protein